MVVIGLTGTVAAGKSTVAHLLAELGAQVIDADRLGHRVLEMPVVQAALRQRWGAGVFAAEQRVDRHAIARRVFAPPPAGPAERQFLQDVTHPHILRLVEAELADAAQTHRVVVVDAALLCEAGWDRFCDLVLLVTAPEPVRWQRARHRGWSRAQFAARQAGQWSEPAKRARAQVVIDNSDGLSETLRQLRHFWNRLENAGIRAFLANGSSPGGQKTDNEN